MDQRGLWILVSLVFASWRLSARHWACALFALVTVASVLSSQDVDASKEVAEEPLWFAFQEEIELSSLLRACTEALGFTLEYQPESIDALVTIQSGPGLTTSELWALTNRHLAMQGLACVQAPGERGLSIVPLAEAASRARLEPAGLVATKAGFIRVLRSLNRADPSTVADALHGILTSTGSQVNAIPATGQLLIAGLAPQVAQALRVVEVLDAAGESIAVESVEVKHLAPTALTALVERVRAAQQKAGEMPVEGSLLANPNSRSIVIVAPPGEVEDWKALLLAFDKAESLVTAHYSPRRFGLSETAGLVQATILGGPALEGLPAGKLVQDELTGTLIVTATWSQQEEVRELIDRLEATPAANRRALRSFPVKHRDVTDLLGILRNLLDEGGLLDGASGDASGESRAPAEGVSSPIAGATGGRVVARGESGALEITLTEDASTNRIVAVGPPRVLDQLGQLIEQLDLQSPQVLVEAMIVSLTEAQTHDLGVELQKGLRRGDSLFRLQSLFGLGSPDPSATSLSQVPGTGLTSVVLDPGSFSGVLRALATVNDGRSLTIPKVLVNNNEQANLNSILQTPYTSTSLSTSTSITSFGGTLDAGTTISVRPQITDGDMLLLNYAVSLSSFVGESTDPSVPPPRQETSLSSAASVPDGYAVVIGGLEIETEGKSTSSLPWLGKLPLVGFLFRNQSTSTSRSRFFVFLRCSVMRSPMFEDLKYVSREDQNLAGLETGAPKVQPLIMR